MTKPTDNTDIQATLAAINDDIIERLATTVSGADHAIGQTILDIGKRNNRLAIDAFEQAIGKIDLSAYANPTAIAGIAALNSPATDALAAAAGRLANYDFLTDSTKTAIAEANANAAKAFMRAISASGSHSKLVDALAAAIQSPALTEVAQSLPPYLVNGVVDYGALSDIYNTKRPNYSAGPSGTEAMIEDVLEHPEDVLETEIPQEVQNIVQSTLSFVILARDAVAQSQVVTIPYRAIVENPKLAQWSVGLCLMFGAIGTATSGFISTIASPVVTTFFLAMSANMLTAFIALTILNNINSESDGT